MKICIIGTGYVGLVRGTCFAELGNQVICVDNDEVKINKLKKLIMPIYEPGLAEIIEETRGINLHFSTNIDKAIDDNNLLMFFYLLMFS